MPHPIRLLHHNSNAQQCKQSSESVDSNLRRPTQKGEGRRPGEIVYQRCQLPERPTRLSCAGKLVFLGLLVIVHNPSLTMGLGKLPSAIQDQGILQNNEQTASNNASAPSVSHKTGSTIHPV